ncbi:MAG: hypothetical protein MJE66_13645 [Proteobacteria bacterium]|nr:hypothetical protein [Pseudomonadota bacterium]
MRQLRQLSELVDNLPVWAQLAIAVALVAYSLVAIYGRIDLDFGAKAFSKIPRDQIRTNTAHIVQYTVVPLLVTIGYLVILVRLHTS